VRLAGTSNFKAKYAGNSPKVTIMDAVPGRMTTPEALESLGFGCSARSLADRGSPPNFQQSQPLGN
jgi:hypothetical protein